MMIIKENASALKMLCQVCANSIKVRAFRGYVCNQALQEKLPSPPYDVLNSKEASKMAEGNQYSFLHVNKPEIDLPPKTDLYSDIVYQTGKQNLQEFIKKGYLHRDPGNVIYIYSQQFIAPQNLQSAPQYGLMLEASIIDYEENRIKKHELTRKDKEADRTKLTHIQNANVGPVFLTYSEVPTINELVTKVVKGYPAFLDYTVKEGTVKVRHMIWKCPCDISQKLEKLFETDVKNLYIADGHHRSASAYNVGSERRRLMKEAGKEVTGNEEFNYFMALVYPKNQLKILDYNRILKDLNGHTKEQLFEKLSKVMEIQEIGKEQYKPQKKGEIGFFFENTWYKLTIKPQFRKPGNPVEDLDVEILYKSILLPVFGKIYDHYQKLKDIKDIRTSKRIDFVGGIRGLGELEKRCKSDCKCAFAMYPVQIEEVMAVADKGQIMPPKSTWFEPKPSSGAIVRCMDYTLEDYMNLKKMKDNTKIFS